VISASHADVLLAVKTVLIYAVSLLYFVEKIVYWCVEDQYLVSNCKHLFDLYWVERKVFILDLESVIIASVTGWQMF